MKRSAGVAAAVGLCVVLGASVARGQSAAVHVDPAKATYEELVPGVSAAVVWGDLQKGPYAAFIKFVPGHRDALHSHTNTSRIVVLNGAYIHKPEKGEEIRVGAGQYLLIPGGNRHVTESDAKEGALFYLESDGGFDLNPAE